MYRYSKKWYRVHKKLGNLKPQKYFRIICWHRLYTEKRKNERDKILEIVRKSANK